MRIHSMKSSLLLLGLVAAITVSAKDDYFSQFEPLKAPSAPSRPVLKKGDRLAICGDSITEQKMYSRIIETYLTVCEPELNVSVRQYGWGGERAPGFLARMTNDCLRFKPTVATTCYGMNDHEYRPYEQAIGDKYRTNSISIVEAFKANGVRVIQGSPGCVGQKVGWSKGTGLEMNQNLCTLRNIGIGIAKEERVGFADVYWPMLTADHAAREKCGADYAIPGKDGVHPGWAGQTIMAYAFLKALGVKGDIGTFTVNLKSNKVKTTEGHESVSSKDGEYEIKSHRYPFVIGEGDLTKDDNIRSGTQWVPFCQEMNRLMLVVKRPSAKSYNVTWGEQTKQFSTEQLKKGINLAVEFPSNPFSVAFKNVDDAVLAKQAFETKQIKQIFRSEEAKKDMNAIAAKTELERDPLVASIKTAFVPVVHTIKIAAQ